MRRARVVGAGVSGLAAALHLAEAGCDVEVIETGDQAGGLIRTRHTPHGLVERAANSFTWTPTTARLFERIGLTPEFASDLSRRRFIFRDGRPRRWPLTPGETLSLIGRRAFAWAGGRLRPRSEETVAAWSARVHGAGATTWLVSPAMQGVYGAPADRLSASIIFGQPRRRTRIAAPAGGMHVFAEQLQVHLESRGVRFRFGAECGELDPTVPTIIATGARGAARLVRPHAPALAAAIARIESTFLVSVTAFFEPHPDDVHGFGVLFPRTSGINAYGVLFAADVFPSRSRLRSETWIYGSMDRDELLRVAGDGRTQLVRDRHLFTGRAVAPVAVYFGAGGVDDEAQGTAEAACAALPLYNDAITAMRRHLHDLPPWLALAGNYLGQLGISKLLDVSREAADRLTGGAG
jgi:oxygen-dependent protoporphyrinogen oxidase